MQIQRPHSRQQTRFVRTAYERMMFVGGLVTNSKSRRKTMENPLGHFVNFSHEVHLVEFGVQHEFQTPYGSDVN